MKNIENTVELVGTVIRGLELDHEYKGEKFYNFILSSERLSEYADELECVISDKIIPSDIKSSKVSIKGSLRSYNVKDDNGKSHLKIYVFVDDLAFVDNNTKDMNLVTLEGYICKKPVYRHTLSEREISDILVAVNRPYGKSDYIPCIAWGRNAKFASNLNISDKVKLTGRFQSRKYNKNINGEMVEKTAYELSVSSLSLISE